MESDALDHAVIPNEVPCGEPCGADLTDSDAASEQSAARARRALVMRTAILAGMTIGGAAAAIASVGGGPTTVVG